MWLKFLSIRTVIKGAGQMTHLLRALTDCSCREPGFGSQDPHGSSQTFLTLVLGDLMPSLLHSDQVCMWCTYLHEGRTLIHVKSKLKERILLSINKCRESNMLLSFSSLWTCLFLFCLSSSNLAALWPLWKNAFVVYSDVGILKAVLWNLRKCHL